MKTYGIIQNCSVTPAGLCYERELVAKVIAKSPRDAIAKFVDAQRGRPRSGLSHTAVAYYHLQDYEKNKIDLVELIE